eukprot:TRINITY_DN9414_c0_g1_i1.p6 TRINITY_DN9414_c0_g1~~TRINITY_DN9414_c0_g1_i1.p6  ORF type:complete len:60 (-),score=10.05 TRINITY_DN9414_c0_g1_i1:99-278(-)
MFKTRRTIFNIPCPSTKGKESPVTLQRLGKKLTKLSKNMQKFVGLFTQQVETCVIGHFQ